MAKVFVVYGPRGAGKTSATVQLGEAIARRGIGVGGFFQRVVHDELERRGYDLVGMHDRSETLPLARPGGEEKAGSAAVCTFSFSQQALEDGKRWLQRDGASDRVLVMDEISKLEVRGEGHASALRWAMGLSDETLLLLSVRGDQLFYVVEAFGLEEHLVGYMEIPVSDEKISVQAERIVSALQGTWDSLGLVDGSADNSVDGSADGLRAKAT